MSTEIMEQQQLEMRIITVPEQARALQIRTPEEFVAVGEFLKTIKGWHAEADATFDPIISKAYAAHKEAVAQKKKVVAPLVEAEQILKPRIAFYLDEQERLRREEELRLQRLAEEEARQRQLEEAAILDDIGETESANALLEEKPYVAPVVVQRNTPKVSGIAMSKRYSAECFDLMQLVRAVAAGKAPIQCLEVNQRFINQQAVSMRTALNYPGVRVIVNSNISAGRR